MGEDVGGEDVGGRGTCSCFLSSVARHDFRPHTQDALRHVGLDDADDTTSTGSVRDGDPRRPLHGLSGWFLSRHDPAKAKHLLHL